MPQPDIEEVPLACIQLNAGENLTEKDIQDYCREKGLKGYKFPQKVDVEDKSSIRFRLTAQPVPDKNAHFLM